MKTAPKFATEADLCAAFIAAVPKGWTAYAETGGWDILLVRDDGIQLGIEAKLTLNAVVLAQAVDGLDSYWVREAPDFRAMLVPAGKDVAGVAKLAGLLGITVIGFRGKPGPNTYGPAFLPSLPTQHSRHDWHEFWPLRRHDLPSIVPDVAAGAPAPVQLTDWKIRALKIIALLDARGSVTRADFKLLGIDPSRWTQFWLRGTPQGYVRCGQTPGFAAQHPAAYAEIVATMPEWAPPSALAVQQQRGGEDAQT